MDNNYLTQLGQTLSEPVFQKPSLNNNLALFGGILSQTADIQKFQAAWKMQEAGVPREIIWQQTGWFLGPDGNWRYEIDDSQASVNFGKGSLNALVNHPEWSKAYPHYQNMPAEIKAQEPFSGWEGDHGHLTKDGLFIQAGSQDSAKRLAIHEMQHATQNYEGFAPGAWAHGFKPELGHKGVPYEQYVRAPGEIEANIAALRANMTPEQRRQNPPWVLWEYLQGK